MAGVLVLNPVIVSDGYGNLINVDHSGKLITDASASTVYIRTIQQAISEGLIPGTVGRSFGYVGTSSTAQTVVRGSTYAEPSSTGQRSMRSSSASDTSAGTGARTVKITYYQDDGTGPLTETITLNGTAWVNAVETDMRFIEKMEVITVGSNGSNIGTITLAASTGGSGGTVGTINADDVVTFWCHHYVGLNTKCVITEMTGGVSGNNGRAFLRLARPFSASETWRNLGQTCRLQNNSVSLVNRLDTPFFIDGVARIDLLVRSDSSTSATWFCDFGFYEVPI